MQVGVIIYKNTGFDPNNIPDATLRASLVGETLPNINVVQLIGLSFVDLPISYQDALQVDYLQLYTTDEHVFYTITEAPQMLSTGNCCRLQIIEDAINTRGLQQSDFITGSILAAHVPHDDYRFCQIPETRFQPSGYLETKTYDLKTSDLLETEAKLTLINATADILSSAVTKDAIIKYGSGGGDQRATNVVIPEIKPLQHQTLYRNPIIVDAHDENGESVPTYEYKDYYSQGYSTFQSLPVGGEQSTGYKIERALNNLKALGLQDSIVYTYDVPHCFIYTMDFVEEYANNIENGIVEEYAQRKVTNVVPVTSRVQNNLGEEFKFEYPFENYTPHNKKVFCGDANKYVVISRCTGNKAEFLPEDLFMLNGSTYTITAEKPAFIVGGDLRAQGSPWIVPLYYARGVNKAMIGKVNGLSWAKHTSLYYGQYGSELVNNNFNFQSAKLEMDTNQALARSTMGATFSATAAATGLITGAIAPWTLQNAVQAAGQAAMFGYNMSQIINNSQFARHQLEYEKIMATTATKSPQIMFPYDEGARDIFGNLFTIIRTRYTKEQAQELDRFFDMWGYQLASVEIEQETDDWLNNREHFNYLSMNNVRLNKDIGNYEKDLIATQLLNVRIWHTLPNNWRPSMGNNIREEE